LGSGLEKFLDTISEFPPPAVCRRSGSRAALSAHFAAENGTGMAGEFLIKKVFFIHSK
jgi:hypothetical protein